MTTLLVSRDASIGDAIAEAIERAGDDVMWCRGPAGADSVCAAARGGRCPLMSGVDAVVVDCWLASDQVGRGLRSEQLVHYYERLGLPVVALTGKRNTRPYTFCHRTITMPRYADPLDVAAAARGAASLRAATTAPGSALNAAT